VVSANSRQHKISDVVEPCPGGAYRAIDDFHATLGDYFVVYNFDCVHHCPHRERITSMTIEPMKTSGTDLSESEPDLVDKINQLVHAVNSAQRDIAVLKRKRREINDVATVIQLNRMAGTNPIIVEIDTAVMGDRDLSGVTLAVIRNDLNLACGQNADWDQVVEAVAYYWNRLPAWHRRKLERRFKK
jgi:hypothetical protein